MNTKRLVLLLSVAIILISGMLGCATALIDSDATSSSGVKPALPSTTGRAGDIDGVRLWTLPDGPDNRLNPDQNWHSLGSDPGGDIYVSGMDHVVNSGLYRLYVREGEDRLGFVGDAKTASEAADNWERGESAEKFHNRPVYYDGKMYLATTDKTDVGGDYRNTRGFHWYTYDIHSGDFVDLSADQPEGVAIPELQILTLALDPERGYIYGMANASTEIVRLDVDSGVTENLGRPEEFNRYVYGNRFMWVDSRGLLYFSAGNTDNQWNQGESVEIYDSLYTYNPDTKAFSKSFALDAPHSIEVGQWTRDRKHAYVMDDRGFLYRFDDEGPSFTPLGEMILENGSVWSLQLSPDERKIYAFWGSDTKVLYEYDIASGETMQLATDSQLSREVRNRDFITGYDAWDNQGRFYVAAFSMYDGQNVILAGIDPPRIKAELGITSELVESSLDYNRDKQEITLTRSAALTPDFHFLTRIEGYNGQNLQEDIYIEYAVSDTQSSVNITLSAIIAEFTNPDTITNIKFTLMADGNDYVTAGETEIELNM